MMNKRPFRRILSGTAALAVVFSLAACSSGGGEGDEGAGFKIDCSRFEEFGDLSGTKVTVYSSIASESEAQPHIDSFAPFEECTGVDVEWEGNRDFEAQMPIRAAAGNAPDIAYFPQPGLMASIVRDYPDQVVTVGAAAEANIDQYYSEAFKSYGTVDGTLYGVPVGANVKSFVWYSPSMFADAGYEIPTTWDELMTLTADIAANAEGVEKPWCAGIESGGATGWPATDWVEDMMLRTATPEQYDQWVSNELPFNDPIVIGAIDKAGSILKNDEYVNGGLGNVATIATAPFTDAGLPILDGQCWMHRQASFYQANWGEGVTVAEDGDVWAFYLPANTVDEHPVLGAGEFATAFRDAPEVHAFQAYLTSPDWSNVKGQTTPNGGWLSANNELDPANLAKPIDKLSYEILADPNTVFRFDGSDLMPSAVGAGTFWTEMTSWIANDKSTQDVADAIQASWPAE
jgi:alpha-glucoside transport system substrate-binding protein